MLKFLGIIIEMGLMQMPQIDYYWSKKNCLDVKSFKIRCREIDLNYFSNFIIFQITEIQVNLHPWLDYVYRRNNGAMERETFVQTIHS